ncbi:MAG TPA: 3-hydroxyacyl-CoA dehydrogenase NAD-binding domain-containing protein [Phycisphaerales bacterium]|nr:3-hydroxyacyl-CoA dehydrogenase NAD-binding domain-containing protein [Phycisphaerales bacterium]
MKPPVPHHIGVIGAGAMGSGIAQVAVTYGWTVYLLDLDETTTRKAVESIRKKLDRLAEKGLITPELRDDSLQRLHVAVTVDDLKHCDLVVEAIVEDINIKADLFKRIIAVIAPDAVLATNTSSLSISKLGEAVGQPARVVGMHFFNPAPLMPLVEVVAGRASSQAALTRVTLLAEAWGKTVVRCNDTPGFIVNRIGRPFYLEAWRILEQGLATPSEIDESLKSLGGFRMGPLELTDLIGQDINLGTTTSIYKQLNEPARLKPSGLQQQLVSKSLLGRKTGKGVYAHDVDPPVPAVQIRKQPLVLDDKLRDAVDRFAAGATDQIGSPLEKYIFSRIVVALLNEAAWVFSENVASARDIDLAMKLGMNFPKGPMEWIQEIGPHMCGTLLDCLNTTVTDNRYRPADSFKARV